MVEQKVRPKEDYFLKMVAETVYLYASRKDSGVREKSAMWEREV